MADVERTSSPKAEQVGEEAKEDAETRAARRELKQSSISDPSSTTNAPASDPSQPNQKDEVARPATPGDVSDAQNDALKDQVSSPKKKRAHDQLDKEKDAVETDSKSVTSNDSSKDRSLRSEPEKKRHRDGETGEQIPKPDASNKAAEAGKPPTKDVPQTSASAFAASTFGKMTTGASPFATLGGSSTASAFGTTSSAPLTSFASPTTSSQAPQAAPPKLSFGGTSSASPFAGLPSGTNGFGTASGNGSAFASSAFGSALGGAGPLQSFAAPGGKVSQGEKPAKPFGAPDSEEEEGDQSGDDDGDEGEEENNGENEDRGASPEKEAGEPRKTRLQKVEVDDGEAGEATVISVRAKIFHHEKDVGWKERGAGMLKINAPQSTVDFDESGNVIPGSFDASGLEETTGESGPQDAKVVRLIMRQDQTHRVILNTAILPAMKFQEKASLKSVGIIFTAFEGAEAKPVTITIKMTAANAKILLNEISVIQRELQSN